jgi:Glycosyl transferase family 2
VLIPVYNGAATVADAITSALAQTLPPAEVFVCDDGSTDELDSAIGGFGARIRVLRQPNGGAPVAQNRGLGAASGEFVAVLDADDVWEPRRIERLVALSLARPDLDILATDLWFERDGRPVGRFYASNPFPLFDQRAMILRRCFMSNPAIRRARLVEIGGFDEDLPIGYDWDCLIRLILDGALAGLVAEPLARYRLHGDSLTGARARSLGFRVRCLEKALAHPSLSVRERAIAEHALVHARARASAASVAEAVHERSPDARRRLLSYALMRGVPLRARGSLLARALSAARW